MSYKLAGNGVIRLADGANIPPEPRNGDWREYQAWLAKGNAPTPADPEPTKPDLSDPDNLEKVVRAVLLAAAAMSGRTPAQARAAFKAAWDALP